jgi:hypothetical protein
MSDINHIYYILILQPKEAVKYCSLLCNVGFYFHIKYQNIFIRLQF